MIFNAYINFQINYNNEVVRSEICKNVSFKVIYYIKYKLSVLKIICMYIIKGFTRNE